MNNGLRKCECGCENFCMGFIEREMASGKVVIEDSRPESMILQCCQCNKSLENNINE